MKTLTALVAALVATLTTPCFAAVTVVTWSGGADFNDAAIEFPGIYSDSLLDVGGAGSLHVGEGLWFGATSVTGTLQIRLNGTWTTIWTDAVAKGASLPLATGIPAPIAFAPGWVTGIALLSDPEPDPIRYWFYPGPYAPNFLGLDDGTVITPEPPWWAGLPGFEPWFAPPTRIPNPTTFTFDAIEPPVGVPDGLPTAAALGLALIALAAGRGAGRRAGG